MLRRIIKTTLPLRQQKFPHLNFRYTFHQPSRQFSRNNVYDNDDDIRRGGDSAFNKKQKEFRDQEERNRSDFDYTIRYAYTLHDYYKILGCKQNSKLDEIKQQFRNLAFLYHPDSQQNKDLSPKKKEELSEKFLLLKEAYDAVNKDAQMKESQKEVYKGNRGKDKVVEDMDFIDKEMSAEELEKIQKLNLYIDKLMQEKKEQQQVKENEEKLKKEQEIQDRVAKQQQERDQMGKYSDVDQKKFDEQARIEREQKLMAAQKRQEEANIVKQKELASRKELEEIQKQEKEQKQEEYLRQYEKQIKESKRLREEFEKKRQQTSSQTGSQSSEPQLSREEVIRQKREQDQKLSLAKAKMSNMAVDPSAIKKSQSQSQQNNGGSQGPLILGGLLGLGVISYFILQNKENEVQLAKPYGAQSSQKDKKSDKNQSSDKSEVQLEIGKLDKNFRSADKSAAMKTIDQKKDETKKPLGRETDPKKMMTYLRIPFERAPEDPSWLTKKKAGRKLDPIEAEEYYKFKYKQTEDQLLKETNWEGIPSHSQIIETIRAYHVFKKSCLVSFYDCQGNRHNKYAFAGPYDECGRLDVFGIWKKKVNEKKGKEIVELLMDHYDLPLHQAPFGLEDSLNTFYQAKYGMFTCHDTLQRIGKVRYADDLIDFWIRNKEDQRYTWYLAIAFVMSDSRKKSWDVLKSFKKDYTQSKAYQAYLKNHPDHVYEVEEIKAREECKDLFAKQDQSRLENAITKRRENLLKKVKFYQSDRAKGKYQVPEEIQNLVSFEGTEDELKNTVANAVQQEMQKEMKLKKGDTDLLAVATQALSAQQQSY